MEKISEKIDLSKQVLEIDIESPIFNAMLHDLNSEIKRVIEKVYDEEFEVREISLKLKLNINDEVKEYPKENEFGELVNEAYGLYTEEKEVKCIDGEYMVVPLKEPQLNMFEEGLNDTTNY
jgi:basic membrane lipoprotein Med (substrate-binding protein (PBP1-ABC) superfamily)